jgi:putative ABC transport system permease protein
MLGKTVRRFMNLQQQFETLRQDIRLALRLMGRSPIFFGASVVTLSLGVGANGAVFSILRSVLLQRLPYDDASRLVLVSKSGRYANLPLEFSGPMAISVRDAAAGRIGDVAAAMLAHSGGQLGAVQGDHLAATFDLLIADRAVRLNGATVTPNFFRVLGVHAALGRLFVSGDTTISGTAIVLSDATWRREFGADSAIIGRAITLASGLPRVERKYRVLGVLPRGVHFTYPAEVEAWMMAPWSEVAKGNPYAVGQYMLVARVRPSVSIEHARQLLRSMPRNPLVAPGDARGGEHDRLDLLTMRDWIVGDTRPSLYLLGGIAALLLLVTCLTVSNALLARIFERRQELGLRSALGADRSRLLQQLIVEGTLLTISGTVAGSALAVVIQPVLRALLATSLPQVGDLHLDMGIIEFAAAMSAVTTMLSAIAPAWGGTRESAAATLVRAGSGSTAGRSAVVWRHALIATQASLTTMLLIFSALLLTSLWRLGRVPLGFDPRNVLVLNVQLLGAKYRAPSAITSVQDELLRGARRITGVTSVGLASAIPFRGFDSPADVQVPESDRMMPVRVRYVDSAFFATFRVPVLRGRVFDIEDRSSSQAVAVVSEGFAHSAFGAVDPVGKTLTLDRPTEIVGVVGNMRYNGLDREAAPAVYVPTSQYPRPLSTLVIRTRPEIVAAPVIDEIRRVLHDIDPALAAVNVATAGQIVDATIAGRRFYSVASGAFAVIALTLTAVGLALVVARVVAERRRELAIRSALGASGHRLVRAAVGDALLVIASGVIAGLLLAAIASALIARFLFQITARSPSTYSGAALVVIGVAGVAAWLPIRTFARLSLAQVLREQ